MGARAIGAGDPYQIPRAAPIAQLEHGDQGGELEPRPAALVIDLCPRCGEAAANAELIIKVGRRGGEPPRVEIGWRLCGECAMGAIEHVGERGRVRFRFDPLADGGGRIAGTR